MRPLAAVCSLILVVTLLFPTVAAAQSTVTVTVAPTAQLQAHNLINVPVTVTCGPLSNLSNGTSNVQVEQAVGFFHVAIGEGSLTVTVCDGTPHTYIAPVIASAPFHFGTALVFGLNLNPCGTNTSGSFECDAASVPPTLIQLVWW
jgi:hypothetical protein